MRILQDNTSELRDPATIVRDQVVHSTKSLLKNQLRRRAVSRSQASYARLCDCGNGEPVDLLNTLDRLPRFRFGGNRNNNNSGKERDLDRLSKELRLRELTERLKKTCATQPLNKDLLTPEIYQTSAVAGEGAPEFNSRVIPLRSASFSQIEYSSDGNKYVRKKSPREQYHIGNKEEFQSAFVTPISLKTTETEDSRCELFAYTQPITCFPDNVNGLCESTLPKINVCNNLVNKECARNSEIYKNATSQNIQERKRDKSRRRKGMYISQWPNLPDESENNLSLSCEFPASDSLNTSEIPVLKISVDKLDSECSNSKVEALDTFENVSPENENFFFTCKNINESIAPKNLLLVRSDSLSEGTNLAKFEQTSDLSDSEAQSPLNKETLTQKRYWKRPLRGPYGQMLEAEMKKPDTDRKMQLNNELKFLEALPGPGSVSLSSSSSVGAGDSRPKCVIRVRGPSNHSLDDSDLKSFGRHENRQNVRSDSSQTSLTEPVQNLVVSHQRTTSSPSKLGFTTSSASEASNELLEELLTGNSEELATIENLQRYNNDMRTHVVIELYETERIYVESLETILSNYVEPLKSPENSGLMDPALVDEVFLQVPGLFTHHRHFVEELKKRLTNWDLKQKVGDIFLDVLLKPAVIECYLNYVSNWKRCREILKAQESKPAFSKFLETTCRESKGKLALDCLLIRPIQKFPKYELLLQRLLKNTPGSHPDYNFLLVAEHGIHETLLKINCTESGTVDMEQLREIEMAIDGLRDLVATNRQYIRHDAVTMTASNGNRKERTLFLFSDLVVLTSLKRKGALKKASANAHAPALNAFDPKKYKLIMRSPLVGLDFIRSKDEYLKGLMTDIEHLNNDLLILSQVHGLAWSLQCSHSTLDEVVKEMCDRLNRQLTEKQNSDAQLSCLELIITTPTTSESIFVSFSKPEVRASWEETFIDVKLKLTLGDRRPPVDLIASVPVRKTRAGLQFTCAAPAITENRSDIWVGNTDGYVGQVCVLSLHPEPNVASCNGVCSSKILCITFVPRVNHSSPQNGGDYNELEAREEQSLNFDSGSSSEDEEQQQSDVDDRIDFTKTLVAVKTAENASVDSEDGENQQSTMWLGTEDGYIYVYNSEDNIRTKKNKIKIQHISPILCIMYLENKVYVSLGNGDLIIYERESGGGWNTISPLTISVGTSAMPVSKLIPSAKKFWCACGTAIKVFNTETLLTEFNVTVSNDATKPITCVMLTGNTLWLSLQNSAIVKCFHALSFDLLCEVNVTTAVTKMLTSCDEIIKQHKAACLRVTALLACKDLLWIGTSAGVLLTMPLPHVTPATTTINFIPPVGLSQGHTGHVRFLTSVEYQIASTDSVIFRHSCKGKPEQKPNTKLIVISGGDGYEDFIGSNASEVAGREDSTNHLLLWNI